MPEYDAFGRPVGEDPLAGLGWPTTPAEQQRTPVPVEPGSPLKTTATVGSPGPAPPAPMPPYRSSSRYAHQAIGYGVFLLVVGAVVFGVVSAVQTGSDAVKSVADGVRQAIPTAVAPQQEQEAGGGSRKPARVVPLTTPSGLRAGIRKLEADVPGRLQTFRLEKSRIDVTVLLKGGRLRNAQLQADAEAAQVFSTTGGGFPATGAFSYDDVRPGAPARLIRAANKRLGKRTSQVNYLVLTRFSGALTWGVYYKDGSIGQGDARGRYTRTIG